MKTPAASNDKQSVVGATLSAQHDATAEAVHALTVAVVRRISRDLSLSALATMSTLERSGPRRITDLASIEGITQPSMTTLITNLERADYVERHHDPSDGRVTLVAMTQSGQDYLRSRRRVQRDEIARLIAKLPPKEAAALALAIPAIQHLRLLDTEERDPAGSVG